MNENVGLLHIVDVDAEMLDVGKRGVGGEGVVDDGEDVRDLVFFDESGAVDAEDTIFRRLFGLVRLPSSSSSSFSRIVSFFCDSRMGRKETYPPTKRSSRPLMRFSAIAIGVSVVQVCLDICVALKFLFTPRRPNNPRCELF